MNIDTMTELRRHAANRRPARLMAKTEQWRSPHKGAKQLADEIYAQLETDAAHQAYGTVDDT